MGFVAITVIVFLGIILVPKRYGGGKED